MSMAIHAPRLIERLKELGATGRDEAGRLCRVAATDADREGRDLFCGWLKEGGLRIEVDRIGNIYGIWEPEGASGDAVVGSHINTVINAGIYDGCYWRPVRAGGDRNDAAGGSSSLAPTGRRRLHQ